MRLYLGRHGEAGRAATDELRELTPKGRSETRFAYRGSVPVEDLLPVLVITSPLIRAQQTADIARECWQLPEIALITTPLLRPEGSVEALTGYLARISESSVLVVGHQPLIGKLLAFLCDESDLLYAPGTSSLFAVDVMVFSRGGGTFEWQKHV